MRRNSSTLFAARHHIFWKWAGLQGITLLLVILAAAPTWLPTQLQAVFMQAFAPFCHQMPARMPHINGTALAVCDRCIGIYSGAVIGVALGGWGRLVRGTLQRLHPGWLLAGALPAIIDWTGPWLGWWINVPLSRLLTGLVLGGAVGLFLVAALNQPRPSASPTMSSSVE